MSHPIQSVQRAISLLRSFTEQRPELGVIELSRLHGLHKSTISRIMSTLQVEGIVSQNPETGKYRLGLGLISLAGVALGRIDIRGIAQPHLTRLLAEVQETVTIKILDDREAVNVERLSSPRALRYVGWIGRRTPLHCTAGGRVLIAWLDPAERAALLPDPLPTFNAKTVTDRSEIESLLAVVRREESAIVREEFESGISSIAAPIWNHAGQIIAAVAISGPTTRLDDETLDTFKISLQETTGRISAELGYTASPEHFELVA